MDYWPTLLLALSLLAGIALARLSILAMVRRLTPRLRRIRPEAGSRLGRLGGWTNVPLPSRRLAICADWIAARLSLRDFTGLPLTLIVLTIVGLAALFTELSSEVVEHEDLLPLDRTILDLLAPLRTPPLMDAFVWFTGLGSNTTLLAVVLVTTAHLWIWRQNWLTLGLWVTLIGSQTMLWAGKYGFGRSRPDALIDTIPTSASFPSGHTAGAMAVYGFLGYALARLAATGRQRTEVIFWACTLIALIGFSRIYLQVHYPSDVAAGLLTGGVWLIAGIAVSEWLAPHRRAAPPTPPTPDAGPCSDTRAPPGGGA